jgi:hypothetical protein
MVNTPYDLAPHIRMFSEALCSRCDNVLRVEGERTWFSVAEYLIRKGWSASDSELVCPRHKPTKEQSNGTSDIS